MDSEEWTVEKVECVQMEWCDIAEVSHVNFSPAHMLAQIWLCSRCMIIVMSDSVQKLRLRLEQKLLATLFRHSSSPTINRTFFTPIHLANDTQLFYRTYSILDTRKPFFVVQNNMQQRISTHLNACTCSMLPTIFIQKIKSTYTRTRMPERIIRTSTHTKPNER